MVIEVVAGRMRHLWDGVKPDRIPLCGSWRCYTPEGHVARDGAHLDPQIATERDKDRRHLCKRCERLAKEKGLT